MAIHFTSHGRMPLCGGTDGDSWIHSANAREVTCTGCALLVERLRRRELRVAQCRPDVIVAWEAARADLPSIRSTYGDVPILVCTWDSRQPWSESVLVAPLPFNAERVALMLHQAVRPTKQPAA